MNNRLKEKKAVAGFAAWENRIAPLFDTAGQMIFVGVESGRIMCQSREEIPRESQIQKALRLVDLGIGTLVCGAISRQLFNMISSYSIQVLPFVAGELNEVIQAWLQGNLESDVYAMPGCCGRAGRRFRGMTDFSQEVLNMKPGRRGMGGGGRGMGGGGGRGGAGAVGAMEGVDYCFCPKCGFREVHERGLPCMQKKCPKCGATLNKE